MIRPAFVLLAMFASLAACAAPPSDLVKAELLADVSAIQPGKPFNLGVMMKIEPGWHTYWKNPGDSGSPTKISFTAPDGFTIEPLQFPTPIEFNQPGDIILSLARRGRSFVLGATPLLAAKALDFFGLFVVDTRNFGTGIFMDLQELIDLRLQRLSVPMFGSLDEQGHQPGR